MIAFSVLAFALIFCLLAVFLFIMYLCSEKICAIMSSIGFGMAMALYIQGNIFKNDYGVLDGNQIKWEEYRLDGFISVSMFILFIVVMIIVERKAEREILKDYQVWINIYNVDPVNNADNIVYQQEWT